MFIDLTHNKIISETISAAFIRSVEQKLVPMLESRYGALLGIQMYEDHLADGFLAGGSWYYPLTLVFADSKKLLWIKWHLTRGNYSGGNPYSYTGESLINFEIADIIPDGFRERADLWRINQWLGHVTLYGDKYKERLWNAVRPYL